MNKGLRTFLFSFFLLAFVAGAPALALYAQGYRLNWPLESGKKLIVKTGGLFVKVHPKQSAIHINGQMEKQTDFFFDSALITNLMPRRHLVEIKKPGYQSWAKNLEIKEKEVAEAKNVFLFPDNLKFSIAEQNITGSLMSPDKQKIALRHQDDIGWSVKLYDINRGITAKLADQSNFSEKNPEFSSWRWVDEKTMEILVNSEKITQTYSIATDKIPAQIIKKPAIDAINAKTDSDSNIPAPATVAKTRKLAEANANGGNYYLEQDGIIRKENGGAAEPAVAAKIEIVPEVEYDLQIFGNYFFVSAKNQLLVAQKNSDAFEKILDGGAAGMKLAPNGKKIAYWSDSEIWVFYLENKTDSPAAKAGEKIFIARLSEKITDCDWFNSDYLIFVAGDSVKTAEIDNRDKINFADLAKISAISEKEQSAPAEMLVRQDKKTIYLFAGGTLYKSDPIE